MSFYGYGLALPAGIAIGIFLGFLFGRIRAWYENKKAERILRWDVLRLLSGHSKTPKDP